MRILPALVTMLVVPTIANAQPGRALLDSARIEIDRAVTQNEPTMLRAARARLERVVAVSPKDAWAHHYIGYALYREAIQSAQEKGKPSSELLAKARESLEKSIALQSIPESHALLSSVLGQSIGSNPFKGMTLGPKSDGEMEKAIAAGPQNPRVWLLNGIGTLHKPKAFGGGLEKAEAHLRKAADLFKSDLAAAPAPSWGHAEAYAWLGQVEVRKKNTAGARAMYAKALEVDPEFGWVKYVLLPALDRPAK